MSCSTAMAFFPAANFMLQTTAAHHEDDHHHHHHHHHQPPTSFSTPILSQDFHGGGGGVGSVMGKRSMSFSGVDVCDQGGEDDLSDDGSQVGEKKRRLNMEQVKTLEKNFELGNKLEPERKMQLARALGLQPRQIAIWFQNRRARWKTKQLEKDYEVLKRQFEAIKSENDALQAHNQKLHAEIMALKNREPTESINLNKETEGSCSNRSENSSDIKLDISRTPAIDSHPTSRTFFPSSNANNNNNNNNNNLRPTTGATAAQHLFHQNSSRTHHQQQDHHHHHNNNGNNNVKEESLCNMFCTIDDQTGFWPWLEQQHFN